MKLVRFLLLAAATVVVVALAGILVAFNSSFQTWAARKALAARPDIHVTLRAVEAGWHHLEVKDIRFEQAGMLLTLPLLELDLPLLTAGRSGGIFISRLVAKGWTLDLAGAESRPSAAVRSTGSAPVVVDVRSGSAGVSPIVLATQAFAGVFSQLKLPVDVSLDGLQLEGEVVLPDGRGRTKVVLQGGGLGAGRTGKFDLTADSSLADPAVNALAVRGTLEAAMDTARTFTRFMARLGASASGTQFPRGVQLAVDLSAARTTAGDLYAAAVVAEARRLVDVQAEFPAGGPKLTGKWKVDLRDADIAPFALGRPLPTFEVTGEGAFDADPGSAAVHGSGRLNLMADRLTVILPELSAIGAVKIAADFDLARAGDVISVAKLNGTISTGRPVATFRSLQTFDFNPHSGELRAVDPARDLLDVDLQGIPVAWAQPFLKEVAVSGGDIRGGLVATARGGGFTLRSRAPLALPALAVAQQGKPLLLGVDITVSASTDYTPLGWQVEIPSLVAKSAGTNLLTLDAKAGRLAGKEQPLKATGKLSANLAGLLAQPAAQGVLALTGGNATVDFVANLDATKEIQAKVKLSDLVADPKSPPGSLPEILVDLRADLGAGGALALNLPIVLKRNGRQSDLLVIGTVLTTKEGRAIDVQVASAQLFVEDAKALSAVLPGASEERPGGAPVGPASRDKTPPWAGLSGSIGLHMKKVVYSDAFEAADVAGTLRVDAGVLALERFQAGLGENGNAKLDGKVTFESEGVQPYALSADLVLTEFDPAPLFRALNSTQPATVEGKFNVSSRVASRAATMAELAHGTHGDFQLTSKSGVFRGLPVNVASKVEAGGKLASGVAFLGNLASAVTGKKEYADIASKAQAVTEVSRLWQAVTYDQISVVLSRDASLNTTVKDFTLISPEMRLTGGGEAKHTAGVGLLDETLVMEFQLRARGRHGELLKYLGALEPQADELGYALCTLPLKVRGTLSKPDTSELSSKLGSLALEKSGVSEKALDLFNRLRGGK